MLKRFILSALTVSLLPALFLSARAQDAPLKIGEAAPAFTTTTLAGKPLSLKSLRGKVVLMDVWATWCGPCRMATPMLQSLHQKFGAKGLQVIGLSVDDKSTVDQVPKFQKAFKLTYTLSASPQSNAKIAQNYNASGIPSIYLIDQKGVVRWCQSGFDQENEEKQLTKMISDLLGSAAGAKGAKTAHK